MTTLQKPNLLAAKAIAKKLKKHHTISRKKFVEVFFKSRKNGPKPLQSRPQFYMTGSVSADHILPQNYDNVIAFLLEQGLMTTQLVNGLRLYFATQKLIRSNINKFF